MSYPGGKVRTENILHSKMLCTIAVSVTVTVTQGRTRTCVSGQLLPFPLLTFYYSPLPCFLASFPLSRRQSCDSLITVLLRLINGIIGLFEHILIRQLYIFIEVNKLSRLPQDCYSQVGWPGDCCLYFAFSFDNRTRRILHFTIVLAYQVAGLPVI